MSTPPTRDSLFSFFFKRSADHRDLHSFPTRRSSDLVGKGRRCGRDSTHFAGHPLSRGRHRNAAQPGTGAVRRDRKSTRLNSSHVAISYAVFCLKKKKTKTSPTAPEKVSLNSTMRLRH